MQLIYFLFLFGTILGGIVSYYEFFCQEHLLKMTSEHRAEMALKRGKPAVTNQGWYSVYCADVNLCCLLVEQVLPPI